MDKYVAQGEACWEWVGAKDKNGYGKTTFSGKTWRAHRLIYTMLKGPIPEGLEIDHTCRNKACVNPAHMEPVTTKVNVHRSDNACAINARKTHCPKGHPLSGENLYSYPQTGWRGCRECIRAYYARTKES